MSDAMNDAMNKVAGLIAKAKSWIGCLGQQNLASFFLSLFLSKTFNTGQPNVLEKAVVDVRDDKLVITIETPINKVDFVGEDGWDYIFSPSVANLLNHVSVDWKVSAEDEVVRLIGSAMGLVFKKINQNTKLHISKVDEDKVKECFKWIDKDVKTILKAIEKKAMRKDCKRKRCEVLANAEV